MSLDSKRSLLRKNIYVKKGKKVCLTDDRAVYPKLSEIQMCTEGEHKLSKQLTKVPVLQAPVASLHVTLPTFMRKQRQC
jgi:hypothetical protein